jgi:CRP-like cAMP-binding protein
MIVQSGRVAIYTPSEEKPGEEQPIRIFESTEAFGEMALIDRKPRSLSARALAPSQVWVLTGESFRSLIREVPDVALAVMAELNDRVRYTTQFLEEVRRWIKRIGEGNYERDFQPDTAHGDPSLRKLAAEFAQMAAQVQQREAELRKEVFQLQIQIDKAKKERQVSEIVESDYFQSLREQAKKLRGD